MEGGERGRGANFVTFFVRPEKMSGEIEPQLSPPPSFSHPVTAAAERAKIESRGRRRRRKKVGWDIWAGG